MYCAPLERTLITITWVRGSVRSVATPPGDGYVRKSELGSGLSGVNVHICVMLAVN